MSPLYANEYLFLKKGLKYPNSKKNNIRIKEKKIIIQFYIVVFKFCTTVEKQLQERLLLGA